MLPSQPFCVCLVKNNIQQLANNQAFLECGGMLITVDFHPLPGNLIYLFLN